MLVPFIIDFDFNLLIKIVIKQSTVHCKLKRFIIDLKPMKEKCKIDKVSKQRVTPHCVAETVRNILQ